MRCAASEAIGMSNCILSKLIRIALEIPFTFANIRTLLV